jgi:hypothetical protein
MEDKLTTAQLTKLRKKLSMMSITSVKGAYQSAYCRCKVDGDKIPRRAPFRRSCRRGRS